MSATTFIPSGGAFGYLLTDDDSFNPSTHTLSHDPVLALQAATKQYVDNNSGGGGSTAILNPVRAATTQSLPASTVVGNVRTANANGAFPALDGVNLVINDRLLDKDSGALGAAHVNNWVWTLTSAGGVGSPWVLTRAADANSSSNVKAGARVAVVEGANYGGSSFSLANAGTVTPGTTAIAVAGTKAGAIFGTYQPGQALITRSVRSINAEVPKGAWERYYTANSFGGRVDTVEADGYNVSGGITTQHQYGRVREATYLPSPNFLQVEEYGLFQTAINPGTGLPYFAMRPGYGMVTQYNLASPSSPGVMICNIDADQFTFRSVTNGTGTWTPDEQVFDFGFSSGGLHFNPGTAGNGGNPSYEFRGHSAQVAGTHLTSFYLGFGVQDGSNPGLLWAVGGPREVLVYLKGEPLWHWALQGTANNLPSVTVGSVPLGGALNVTQGPAGNGFLRGVVIQAAAIVDAATLEIRKSDDSVVFAVDPVLIHGTVNVAYERNLGIGSATPSYGGGIGVGFLEVATTVPTSDPSSGFIAYVDPADDALKVRGKNGTITTLAAA